MAFWKKKSEERFISIRPQSETRNGKEFAKDMRYYNRVLNGGIDPEKKDHWESAFLLALKHNDFDKAHDWLHLWQPGPDDCTEFFKQEFWHFIGMMREFEPARYTAVKAMWEWQPPPTEHELQRSFTEMKKAEKEAVKQAAKQAEKQAKKQAKKLRRKEWMEKLKECLFCIKSEPMW